MHFRWTYTGCNKAEEAQIAELWRSRQAELQAKVGRLEDQRSHLWVAVEHADANSPAWTMRAALLSSQELFASEQGADSVEDAMDLVVSELSQQVDETLDRPEAVRQERRGINGMTSILESLHSKRRSDAFFSFLMPLVRSLRRYAQREIRTRRLQGELPSEQLTVRDVLDEVLLQAWNEFGRRPRSLPLDLWLVQLIDQVIEVGTRRIADESLDDRQPEPSDEPQQSRTDEWVELPTELETIELSRLLPGEPGIETWDELEVEVKQSHLDEIFSRLSRSQRQVLMLHAVEGFEKGMIADFQDRTEAEVDEDLAAARLILQRMARDVELPEIEEQLEKPSFKKPRRSHRT